MESKEESSIKVEEESKKDSIWTSLADDWKQLLSKVVSFEDLNSISENVLKQYKTTTVYPPRPLLFEALNLCPVASTRVVILGQDPYHTPGIANGLAFSHPPNVHKFQPSLRNIIDELLNEYGLHKDTRATGDLSCWARQGVLLLNTILTVHQGVAKSHHNVGWQQITANLICEISLHHPGIVFILWGRDAQDLKKYIENPKTHLILECAHPSPLSAHRGFFGCNHFLRANSYLVEHNHPPIQWKQIFI